MKFFLNSSQYFETNQGIDLSVPLRDGTQNVNAWYCDPVRIEAVRTAHFIGDINEGGVVNFKNIFLNPHGNGTHTECLGHIAKEEFTINQCLKEFHFFGRIITVKLSEFWNEAFQENDRCIGVDQIRLATQEWKNEKVLIVRTLPNDSTKQNRQYSDTNPPYFTAEAIDYINELGVDHLMVDLPSIDREQDEGQLVGHHRFWNYPGQPQTHKTISELLFIPDNVKDKRYMVNIQIMSIESDASPSKIMVYPILDSKD